MKHEGYFKDFLKDHVNLNSNRLDKLEKKIEVITVFLEEKLDNYSNFSEQGSYAHGTIIKPVKDSDEFDADILIYIKDNNFEPQSYQTDYVSYVYDQFKDNKNYQNIVKRKARCVTVDYAGDFHLDVVPCILHGDQNFICNRNDQKYEKTDGDGYKNWLAEKNAVAGQNQLKKVTRLFKYLRDHKSNFTIASILLTTLLGNHIDESNNKSEEFKDLPTSLKTLSNRVNDFLQQNSNMPIIENPVLEGEDFNRKWDENKYKNFRNKFNIYNQKINDAFSKKDHNESVKKWRKIFGENFGKSNSSSTNSVLGPALVVSNPQVVNATKPYANNK